MEKHHNSKFINYFPSFYHVQVETLLQNISVKLYIINNDDSQNMTKSVRVYVIQIGIERVEILGRTDFLQSTTIDAMLLILPSTCTWY